MNYIHHPCVKLADKNETDRREDSQCLFMPSCSLSLLLLDHI